MRCFLPNYNWACAWQNQQIDLCAQTQISLVIRPVWSESSLSAWRINVSSYTKSAQRRLKSDWADTQPPSMIWVIVERIATLMVLSCCDSNKRFYNDRPLSGVNFNYLIYVTATPTYVLRTHTRTHTHIFSCKFIISCKFLRQMQQRSKTIPLLIFWEQIIIIVIKYQRIYFYNFLFVSYHQ